MQTQRIPYSQWSDCLDQFSRAHHGQMVTVATLTPDIGIRCNIVDVPLLGVTMEHQSKQFRHLIVEAGDQHGLFTHSVADPVELRTRDWNDGISAVLDIESANREITQIRVGPKEQLLAPGVLTDELWERE